jgi:hypothetical protein
VYNPCVTSFISCDNTSDKNKKDRTMVAIAVIVAAAATVVLVVAEKGKKVKRKPSL